MATKKTSKSKNKSHDDWFEFADFPKSLVQKKSWVPLRVVEKESIGKYGYVGYKEEFFGLGSIAVPLQYQKEAEKMGWSDVGISHSNSGYYDDQDKAYIPSEQFRHHPGDVTGIHLVLEIEGNGIEKKQWLPNQDLVVTLGLVREGNVWLRPSEGYVEVIKIQKDDEDNPSRIEIKTEFLLDYLSARGMGLYVTYYTSRTRVDENKPEFDWPDGYIPSNLKGSRWEGRVGEIHEGGMPYGEKWAVFHVARTDVDENDDIPDISEMPTDDNTESNRWEKGYKGKKLYRIMGELWKNEWLPPGDKSPRVKGDNVPSSIQFIIDEKETNVSGDELVNSGKWLWFKPELVMAIAHRRGGSLLWYTRDTGQLACLPHYGVHFGINNLGLINVFAKDIGLLPEWQQRLWAGFNVTPDGGVSSELISSQVRAEPAKTQSPEQFLDYGIKATIHYSQANLGFSLFRDHDESSEILARTHRFRAVDRNGLLALAKDISRLTVERIDVDKIKTLAPPPKEDFGSLKCLQHLLSTKIGESKAYEVMTPLFMVNELRQGDAHLPSKDIDEVLSILTIPKSAPFIFQGGMLIHSVVSGMYKIIGILKDWDLETEEKE